MGNGKKQNTSIAATVATAIIAVAAAAAVAAVLVMLGNKQQGEDSNSSAQVSVQTDSEYNAAAGELVQKNYEIIRLFVTEGLPFETVYGNSAEDGYHSVNDSQYKTYSQIEELVKSVYVGTEADRVLKRFPVKAESGTKEMQVYKDHNDPADGELCLGINEEFKPDTSYSTDWSKCVVKIEPENENFCTLTVIVNGYTEEEASSHPESVLTTKMIKYEGKWLLSEMLM